MMTAQAKKDCTLLAGPCVEVSYTYIREGVERRFKISLKKSSRVESVLVVPLSLSASH